MGGFLLVKREQGTDLEDTERQYRDSLNVFAKKGLPLNKKLSTSEYVIYVFHKQRYNTDNTMLFDNGDFIIATGTMLYKGKTGDTALKELYRDFSADNQGFFTKVLGNSFLIIFKGNKLFLCNNHSGIYRAYCDQSKRIFSSSFLAVYKSLEKRSIGVQELYEYIFEGAFYADKTLIREIELFDNRTILQLYPVLSTAPKILSFQSLDANSSFNEMVSSVSINLIDYFAIIKSNFNDSVCLGLTSGSDTRLMLALMRKVGINPYLYVYGKEHAYDVIIAKMIAKGERMELDHEDTNIYPRIKKEEFPGFLENQHYLIDGLGNVGIFDNGANISNRLKRIKNAQLQLNGAGDLATLYYPLPDKTFSIKSIIKAKYDTGDYSMCRHEHFNKSAYFMVLTQKIKYALNTDNDRLDKRQLEMLRLLMHAKYWTAFNHMINNQLADALLPYYEPKYVYGVLDIPYKFKYLGVFKAALIRYIDPALAKYPTQNGITFNDFGNIPPRVKISTFIKYHVPIMLRPYIRAHFWNQENKGKFPYYLTKEYLDTIPISPDLAISEYVDIDKIKDPDMFSRVLSVELLLNGKL